MVQFLSINFFSWIYTIYGGFSKVLGFFVSPCINLLGFIYHINNIYVKKFQDFYY